MRWKSIRGVLPTGLLNGPTCRLSAQPRNGMPEIACGENETVSGDPRRTGARYVKFSKPASHPCDDPCRRSVP
jgi:hypothetical protein